MGQVDLAAAVPVGLIVEIFVIIFLLGYVFFSFLVIRQVNVMCSVVESHVNPTLKFLAQIQLIAGILVLIIAAVSILV